eukprot:2611209-Lingulodinium_polyedra.AAC.1
MEDDRLARHYPGPGAGAGGSGLAPGHSRGDIWAILKTLGNMEPASLGPFSLKIHRLMALG